LTENIDLKTIVLPLKKIVRSVSELRPWQRSVFRGNGVFYLSRINRPHLH